MTWHRRVALLAAVVLCTPAAGAQPSSRALPASRLAVRVEGHWHSWWRGDSAPTQWGMRGADAVLASRAQWKRAAPGVEWAELELAGTGEAWRTRLVVARLDPARLTFTLVAADGGRADWRVEQAPADAAFAINAGQFIQSMPWGWMVLDGEERLSPMHGPLSTAVVIDSAGAVHWLHGDSLWRARPRGARWAFQSYPTLLSGGEVPAALRGDGAALDLAHRDARAAIGRSADGQLIVALTRFDALGGSLGFIPFGLTVPEMAAVMGALGARDAVLLDGGISAQMLVRETGGVTHQWSGLRAVPLGLVASQRMETIVTRPPAARTIRSPR
jgi:hypothetical protein